MTGRAGDADKSRRSDSWDEWADTAMGKGDPGRSPVFLGRDIYRRRRVMDAARLLPALGTVFLLLPILWASERGTAPGAVYVFVIWFVLIVAAAILSRRLSEPLRDGTGEDRAPDGEI